MTINPVICLYCEEELSEKHIFCQQREYEPAFSLYSEPTLIPVYHCPNCSLYFSVTRKTKSEVETFYANEYHDVRTKDFKELLHRKFGPAQFDCSLLTVSRSFLIFLVKALIGKMDPIQYHLLRSFPPLFKKHKVLEVGFGTGGLLTKLIQYGYDAYGIEPSQTVVDHFKKSHSRPNRFFQSTIENISAGDILKESQTPFSAVLFSGSLCYVRDLKKTFQTVDALLANGGQLIIRDMNADNDLNDLELIFEMGGYSSNRFSLNFYQHVIKDLNYSLEAFYFISDDWSRAQKMRMGVKTSGILENRHRWVKSLVVLKKQPQRIRLEKIQRERPSYAATSV